MTCQHDWKKTWTLGDWVIYVCTICFDRCYRHKNEEPPK